MITDYKTLCDGFMVDDVISLAKSYGITISDSKIHNICSDAATKEIKVSELKEFTLKADESELILATAFISTEEFPESEYYLYKSENNGSKKPIPVNEVLARESEIYEAAGFVNINNFVGYEYKIAFIYPNKSGKKIIKAIKEMKKTKCD